MSKFTTVTKQNAHLILFRINKFLQRNEAVSFYTDWGKFPKEMNKLGIYKFDDNKYIEKSNTGYILKSKYKIELNPDYGIIIRSSKDCVIGIVFGDKVSITPNRLAIKGYELFNKTYHTDYYAPSNELKKAERNYECEQTMSDDYWDIVNEEHIIQEVNAGQI